jgi:hypothetical protein
MRANGSRFCTPATLTLEDHPTTNRTHAFTGTCASRDPAGDRRPAQTGEQRLISAQRICFFRLGLQTQASAFEQSADAPDYSIRYPGRFGVIRRKQPVKPNSTGERSPEDVLTYL